LALLDFFGLLLVFVFFMLSGFISTHPQPQELFFDAIFITSSHLRLCPLSQDARRNSKGFYPPFLSGDLDILFRGQGLLFSFQEGLVK